MPSALLPSSVVPPSLSASQASITKLLLWVKEKQLVCILILHFLLLMALTIASALLIITHMSLLLSMHRFMRLSQMFLGLAALAVFRSRAL